jgi:eukaryotic-like serine/threonine-protein kinase
MAIEAGTALGPYEIESMLGAGGMGEVYRALDRRLQRSVAVKVLRSDVATDGDRLARFEQEARATAALNHPNIVAVFDVGTANGSAYIVSELLTGETLRDRLRGGAVPARKTVEIALQLAAGLASAHERGIAHRDLKPENIFLTTERVVKILDFGLAKLLAPMMERSDSVATVSVHSTGDGVVLGTAGYMAPEQVRGLPADHRSDIFAFGTILYEMLFGVRAFRGETAADTMSAILTADPPEIAALRSAVPAPLNALARRCLEKNPQDRFQSARDLGFALQAISLDSSDAMRRVDRPHSRAAREIARSTALVAAAALATWMLARPEPADRKPLALSVVPPAGTDLLGAPSLAPDGKSVAFVASDAAGATKLFTRTFDSTSARAVAGTDGAELPFWSPDSRFLGFFAYGKLWRIELAGGSPRLIAQVADPRGATWNADDVIVLAPNGDDGLYRVSGQGGTLTAITRLDRGKGEISHRWPRFLPDGKHVLFLKRIAEAGPTRYVIANVSIDGSAARELLEADSWGVVDEGRLIFQRGSTVYAQPFDVARLELTGEALPVLDQSWNNSVVTAGFVGFDAAGGLLAARSASDTAVALDWFDRSGKIVGSIAAPGGTDVTISPDGRYVAYNRPAEIPAVVDLWLLDVGRNRQTKLGSATTSPAWSPGSDRLAYSVVRSGTFDLFTRGIAPGSPERELLHTDGMKAARSWSSDGRHLLFNAVDSKTRMDVWVIDPIERGTPRLLIGGDADQGDGSFSPDGSWVAYVSNESGRPETYVCRFDSPGTAMQISTAGGGQPQWRADGRELYYLAPDNALMAVPIAIDARTLIPGAPIPLFRIRTNERPARQMGAVANRIYSASPRGDQFVVSHVPADAPVSTISLLFNWARR